MWVDLVPSLGSVCLWARGCALPSWLSIYYLHTISILIAPSPACDLLSCRYLLYLSFGFILPIPLFVSCCSVRWTLTKTDARTILFIYWWHYMCRPRRGNQFSQSADLAGHGRELICIKRSIVICCSYIEESLHRRVDKNETWVGGVGEGRRTVGLSLSLLNRLMTTACTNPAHRAPREFPIRSTPQFVSQQPRQPICFPKREPVTKEPRWRWRRRR